MQPIAIDGDYADQNPPVIDTWHTMAFGKVRSKLHHFIFAQPIKIAHIAPQFRGDESRRHVVFNQLNGF